jgi:hypothetical protein
MNRKVIIKDLQIVLKTTFHRDKRFFSLIKFCFLIIRIDWWRIDINEGNKKQKEEEEKSNT